MLPKGSNQRATDSSSSENSISQVDFTESVSWNFRTMELTAQSELGTCQDNVHQLRDITEEPADLSVNLNFMDCQESLNFKIEQCTRCRIYKIKRVRSDSHIAMAGAFSVAKKPRNKSRKIIKSKGATKVNSTRARRSQLLTQNKVQFDGIPNRSHLAD